MKFIQGHSLLSVQNMPDWIFLGCNTVFSTKLRDLMKDYINKNIQCGMHII